MIRILRALSKMLRRRSLGMNGLRERSTEPKPLRAITPWFRLRNALLAYRGDSVQTFLLIVTFLFVGVSSAHAQFIGQTQRPQINISPAYPEPFDTVEATLDAYSFATDGAIIQWFVDGVELTNAQNMNDSVFDVGALGTETVITVQLTMPDGRVLTGSRSITPASVDIVIEADTTTPLHYKGRALPSGGSTIRAIAIPQLGTQSGNLTYKWTYNNKVLGGSALVGNDVVTFDAPMGGQEILSVAVIDQSGQTVAKKNIYVSAQEPEMYFYEDNPLRGLSRTAIMRDYQLLGEELVVRAEPYFMDAEIFAQDPHTRWKVNGRELKNPSDDPQQITLRRAGGVGSFDVTFRLINREEVFQAITEGFSVSF